jgi:ABC-2 type transport system permease protein
MNILLVLIRREYWENRSLWIAPLVIAGIILVSAAFGGIHTGDNSFSFGTSDGPSDSEIRDILGSLDKRQMIYGVTISTFTVFQLIVLGIVVFFYLLDSLLGERQDRSILFWKSLPISDAQVVGSKLLTALVTTPAYVLLVSAATQLVFGLIWWVRMRGSPLGEVLMPFDAGIWLQVQAGTWMLALAAILWYLPIAGYLLLVSVWARKRAFLWALLPPVSLLLAEGLLRQSHHVGDFLVRRLGGIFQIIGEGDNHYESGAPSLADMAGRIGAVLTHWETWAGVAAAAALIAATIRIRRYRDDG